MKFFQKLSGGADFWKSRAGLAVAASAAVLLWFDIDWCMTTTFRAMGDWLLWVNTIAAALVLALPYALTRRMWVQLLVLALAGALMEANLMYCRTYFAAIPLDSYMLAGNLSDFTASVADSLRWPDLGLPLILVATALLAATRVRREGPANQVWRILAFSVAFGAIGAVGVACRGGFYKEYDRLAQSCYFSTCGVPIYTLGGHIAYSVLDRQKATGTDMSADITAWIDEHARLLPYRPLPDSVATRRNLVLVLCESLESWPLEARVGGVEITPYLNSLTADSTTFYAPNVLTQVASGRSIDAQLMITTGLLPMNGTVFSMKHPYAEYPTLNKALQLARGASSQIYTADNPVTWNQDVIRRSFGYDSLFDRRSWTNDELIGSPAKLSDGSFLRQGVAKVRQSWPEGEPRMLTFVTYSGHNPFRVPERLKDPALSTAVAATDMPQRLKDYVEMAHYTDSQLHTLVDYLRSRSDFDSTLVVIVGDHEGLGTLRDEALATSDDARGLVARGGYTPFIVLNAPVAGRDERVAAQVDIYSTLLAMLGLDSYGWKGMGQNIADPQRVALAISSMTSEMAGDTTGVAPAIIDHLRRARRISDAAIRSDYFIVDALSR